MNKLPQHFTDKQTGISYTLNGDYYLPDLAPPEEFSLTIGKYGRMRLNYLKNHRRVLYFDLLTSGKLNEHLREIDVAAFDRGETIVRQMAKEQGVSEQLKSENQMLWVGMMNNILSCSNEIVQNELIYQ